jgi:hypothetical protein
MHSVSIIVVRSMYGLGIKGGLVEKKVQGIEVKNEKMV